MIAPWAALTGNDALLELGETRGPDGESTIRRAYGKLNADFSTGSSAPGSLPAPDFFAIGAEIAIDGKTMSAERSQDP